MHLIPDARDATPHTSGQLHWSGASSSTTTTSALLSSPAKKGVWVTRAAPRTANRAAARARRGLKRSLTDPDRRRRDEPKWA